MPIFVEPEDEPLEIYRSMSPSAAAATETVGAGEAAVSPFTIEVRFLGGLTPSQTNAFKTAADRWTRVIVGDLPSAKVGGEMIDDLVIVAQGANIDGSGKVLGQAGPTHLRPKKAGAAAFLPAKGRMTFDTADLGGMEQRGTLVDVITHEMGHVLGIGTVWRQKDLLKGRKTRNPTFQGQNAMREYGVLKGTGPTPVPVENTGGPGTANSHWREILFHTELMSGFISAAGNPISRMTVASLLDLGYQVDLDAADPYRLPSLTEAAEAFAEAGESLGMTVLPILPVVLPGGSVD